MARRTERDLNYFLNSKIGGLWPDFHICEKSEKYSKFELCGLIKWQKIKISKDPKLFLENTINEAIWPNFRVWDLVDLSN